MGSAERKLIRVNLLRLQNLYEHLLYLHILLASDKEALIVCLDVFLKLTQVLYSPIVNPPLIYLRFNEECLLQVI